MTVKTYNNLIDEMKALADKINKHYDTVTLETVEELDTPTTETQRILNELKDKGVLTEEDLYKAEEVVTEGPNDAWYAKEAAKEKYAKDNDGKDLFKQGIDVQEKWIAKEMKERGYKKVEGRWIKESFSPEVIKVVKEAWKEEVELNEVKAMTPDQQKQLITMVKDIYKISPNISKKDAQHAIDALLAVWGIN